MFYIVWELATPRVPHGARSWRSRKINSRSDFESFEFVSVEANHPYLVKEIPDLRWLFQPDIPPGLTPIISINTVHEQAASANPPHVAGKMMGWNSYVGAAEPPAST